MLETKNLVKIYKPKKGVPVRALDGVSLKFPDKGMVFLLGKSGSGKSTLLNLLGGLDRYDEGEIIIKGVSSKQFKQQHFDSYRNTYVGFIFQEYNILEEFSVGANIALALELQGKKATDEELNRILHEVDLDGYASRKPNELSGGQKQRVAIARALVKNPKIIMADEPSGALDSATGKQVFDTLKKLSKEKLVIVVSHDRDFANEYADRIIELADGMVISDTTLSENDESEKEELGIIFEGESAKIPITYRLTEEDRIRINEYLENLQNGGTLEFTNPNAKKNFTPTVQENIKSEDSSPFKLIKSKLALKHAFKIGSSGLKHKKFRLVMTVLLSCVAFVMFGLVDTFTSYDHISATANSVYDSGVKYAAVSKSRKIERDFETIWRSNGMKITDEDIEKLSKETGVEFKGVINDQNQGYYFNTNVGDKKNETSENTSVRPVDSFGGIVETSENALKEYGYELVAGRLPDGTKNELALSKYIYEFFEKSGYRKAWLNTSVDKKPYVDVGDTVDIKTYSDLLGKTLFIEGEEFEVVGIVDTDFDISRYKTLFERDELSSDATDMIVDYVLLEEYNNELRYSYTGMMLVGEGFVDGFIKKHGAVTPIVSGHMNFDIYNYDESTGSTEIVIPEYESNYSYFSPSNYALFGDIDNSRIIWLGEEKTELGEKEIIISSDILKNWFGLGEMDKDGFLTLDLDKITEKLDEIAEIEYNVHYFDYYDDNDVRDTGFKIVGVYDTGETFDYSSNGFVVMNDNFYKTYFTQTGGKYDIALAIMPDNVPEIKALAEYCYTDREGKRYEFKNPASFELDAMHEVIVIASDALLYVGIFFAIFASILLSNFIATSISYKKQEIGILRAIGSRGNDVFRIFFAEAFIIAVINFVLACIGTGLVTAAINALIREELGLLVTVLNFGIRQILLVFAVSVGVAALASFLPVKKIASKRPIDAIRNR